MSQATAAKPFTVTDASFEKDVLQSDLPVLVDFWAEWCGPCRMIAPALEELAAEYDGRARIAKLNIDDCPKTAMRFGVRSIPTLILFRDGEASDTSIGVKPKAQLAQLIDRHLG
ncbi:MAG: thioredoxin [Gammaproteobacteria bacterium]|nr:thioredoxin [Gammaproteobacteria bacterium]MDH4254822.1 thioredoxin [Gammaproteobacteria bacterium]MDH5309844.1 thioredoxin [Gammaproteobacteria bacterium]